MSDQKTLVFKPEGSAFFKRSPLYALAMLGQIVSVSTRYMMEAIRGKADVPTTDIYIKEFFKVHFECTHTRLYVTGLDNLMAHETYIFMSNHESWMDIPAIFGAVPHSVRMISKAGLMKVPVFGNAMVNAGFIAVDRQNRNKAIRQLDKAKHRLADGISIWLAPEGTRSRDGNIAPFKKGGFHLARSFKKAIVPVFIEGAAKVMPADSMMIATDQSITVHFLQPIAADLWETLSMSEMVTKVRSAIIDKKQELEKNHVAS